MKIKLSEFEKFINDAKQSSLEFEGKEVDLEIRIYCGYLDILSEKGDIVAEIDLDANVLRIY